MPRCEVGDRAFIIRAPDSFPELQDRLVDVVRAYHTGDRISGYTVAEEYPHLGVHWVIRAANGGTLPAWLEHTRKGFFGVVLRRDIRRVELQELMYPDEWLRPIRDTEGPDESLTWADVPKAITTPPTPTKEIEHAD